MSNELTINAIRCRKYRADHHERVICSDCCKSYIKSNKGTHLRSKYHKLIVYCKKVMFDHNTYIKNKNIDNNMLVNVNGV